MLLRNAVLPLAVLATCAGAALRVSKSFREYPGQEYNDFPVPPDYTEKIEFIFARLMYPDAGGGFGFRRQFADWREGYTNWTNDYPRSDRHLMVALRRLTRLHVRSVEQPVNLEDDGDVLNYPFLYMVRAGNGQFTAEQVIKLREYLARGGFFIADDIWGDRGTPISSRIFRGSHPTARSSKCLTPTRRSIPFTTWTIATRFPASGRFARALLT